MGTRYRWLVAIAGRQEGHEEELDAATFPKLEGWLAAGVLEPVDSPAKEGTKRGRHKEGQTS